MEAVRTSHRLTFHYGDSREPKPLLLSDVWIGWKITSLPTQHTAEVSSTSHQPRTSLEVHGSVGRRVPAAMKTRMFPVFASNSYDKANSVTKPRASGFCVSARGSPSEEPLKNLSSARGISWTGWECAQLWDRTSMGMFSKTCCGNLEQLITKCGDGCFH